MSATPRLILISGWAHTAADLEDLRQRIKDAATVCAVSTADLWNETRDNESSSAYARNLKAMVERNGGKTFIAGWSLGGMIALETALYWPELVKGLIIISSTPKFCLGPGWSTGTPTGAIRAMLLGLKHDPHTVFKSFYENVMALSKDAEVAVKAKTALAAGMNPRELIYGLEYLRDKDFSGKLQSLAIPALIIHGRLDSIINVESARQLNRLLALSSLRVYDDYGHGLPCQNPQAVAEDIMRFIKECGKSGISHKKAQAEHKKY